MSHLSSGRGVSTGRVFVSGTSTELSTEALAAGLPSLLSEVLLRGCLPNRHRDGMPCNGVAHQCVPKATNEFGG